MKIELIYNLKSIFIKKEIVPVTIKSTYNSTERIMSLKNINYNQDGIEYKFIPYDVKKFKLTAKNINDYNNFPLLFKHSVLPFYSNMYAITNPYLLKNIEEFYRITKVFVIMFNDKYKGTIDLELIDKPDVIFNILKFHESKLVDIKQYSQSKVDDIISKELYNNIKRL